MIRFGAVAALLSSVLAGSLVQAVEIPEGLKGAMGRDFVVLLGEEDTGDADPGLRNTDRARAQGRTRPERGETFHQTALATARKQWVPLSWRRIVVRDAGRSNREMAWAAAALLLP
jgi:hypothetical protein